MLGMLCGLQSEARLAKNLRHMRLNVACSACRADLAAARAAELVAGGAHQLVSFGLAVGLDPALRPGTLILGTSVQSAAGEVIEGDRTWAEAIAPSLPWARQGAVLDAPALLKNPDEKAALFAQTSCLIADMESLILARAARAAGRPFLILRAVADTAAMTLAPAAAVPLTEEGCVNLPDVLRSLCRQPGQLPSLLHLAANTAFAMKTLKKTLRILDRDFR